MRYSLWTLEGSGGASLIVCPAAKRHSCRSLAGFPAVSFAKPSQELLPGWEHGQPETLGSACRLHGRATALAASLQASAGPGLRPASASVIAVTRCTSVGAISSRGRTRSTSAGLDGGARHPKHRGGRLVLRDDDAPRILTVWTPSVASRSEPVRTTAITDCRTLRRPTRTAGWPMTRPAGSCGRR